MAYNYNNPSQYDQDYQINQANSMLQNSNRYGRDTAIGGMRPEDE